MKEVETYELDDASKLTVFSRGGSANESSFMVRHSFGDESKLFRAVVSNPNEVLLIQPNEARALINPGRGGAPTDNANRAVKAVLAML